MEVANQRTSVGLHRLAPSCIYVHSEGNERPRDAYPTRSVVRSEIIFGDDFEFLGGERIHCHFNVVDENRDHGPAMRPHQKRVGLDDIQFGLKQCGAHLEQRLRTRGKFDSDQVGLYQCQASAFENLSSLFRMTQQKPNASVFERIVNRQRHYAHAAAFKSPHDLEQLSDAVLKKHGELSNGGIVPSTHRGKIGACPVANAHPEIRFS
jgi:hypothetical protein